MSKIFAQNIDLNKNEALNFRLENQITFPSVTAPDAGFVFFHSANEKFYGWDGSGWTELGLGGAGAADGVVSNVALAGTDLNFTGSEGGFNGTVDLSSLGGGADNLGNHIATQKLDMNNFGIDMNIGGSIFIGDNSGLVDDGTDNQNVGIGINTLKQNTSGFGNIGIGIETLRANISGSQNVALGNYTLYNSTGNSNIGIGISALYNNTIGSSNVAIGVDAMRQHTDGFSNVVIGTNAGDNDSADLRTNDYGILIGAQSDFSTNTSSREMAIGYNVTGRGSNTMTIGDSNLTSFSFGSSIHDISALTTTRNVTYPDVSGNIAILRESTWTPTVIDKGSGATYNMGTQIGYYTRVGETVILHGTLTVTSTTGTPTGAPVITGIPFTVNQGATGSCIATNYGVNFYSVLLKGQNSELQIYTQTNLDGSHNFPIEVTLTNFTLQFTLMYRTTDA